MARPASCRVPPYPMLTRRSTTNFSKKDGDEFAMESSISCSRFSLSARYADARESSGVSEEGDSVIVSSVIVSSVN